MIHYGDFGTHDKLKHIGTVWDKKRKAAWILGGLIIGTYISYSDSITDDGVFSWKFFLFMETLVILIMGTLFFFYSRKK